MKGKASTFTPHWARVTPIALSSYFCVICVICGLQSPGAESSAWGSRNLLPDFYSEGVSTGDLDGDGAVDIAYGPFWFKGPVSRSLVSKKRRISSYSMPRLICLSPERLRWHYSLC